MNRIFHSALIYLEKTQRSVSLAVRSLWLHKLRMILSVLGIIIGTGAVIALMAFGEGSMQDALDDIKRQGATNVIIRSVKPPDDSYNNRRAFIIRYGLTNSDYERFKMINSVVAHVPMRVFPQEVRRLHRIQVGRVVATLPEYASVHKIELAVGRFLRSEDDRNMRNVAVLGAEISRALFPFKNPVGETIVLKGNNYIVVGVVKDRMPTGGSGGSLAAEEFNNDVYIPIKTALGRYGERIFIRQSGSRTGEQVELHQVTLTISDMDKVRAAGEAVRDQLRRWHDQMDWAVTIPLDRLEQAERARDRYKMLLLVIASISLLVGGIGIMNIMLATVTERTREIGIRRALGAKRRDITLQFLIEAIVQTGLGGLLGVLTGLAIVYGVPPIAQEFFKADVPAKLYVPAIFLSLGMAIGVGVLFGLYPSMRASRLDPIEALRHE